MITHFLSSDHTQPDENPTATPRSGRESEHHAAHRWDRQDAGEAPFSADGVPQTPDGQEQTPGVSLLGVLGDVVQIVLPAVLLALGIHIFLAQATVVYGQSMQPSLQPTERLVIEKVSYYLGAPERNDIVVVDLPHMSELLIKRVVGLPGETVAVRNGVLYIDGNPTDQRYDHIDSHASFGPITLRPMTYFVMGDNRVNSNDSRAFGPVDRTTIVGRAWLRYWPLNRLTVFD